MSDKLKEMLFAAANVVVSRKADVYTEDGVFAAVDADDLIRLDMAIAKFFELDSDDVTYDNFGDLMNKIGSL